MNEKKLLRRDALMTRQKGNLSGSLLHMLRGFDGNAEATAQKAYLDHLTCDLADLLKQCEVLASDLGLNVADIRELGHKRYTEAREQFVKKNKIEHWI
jgi:hypothetical protein